MESNRATDPMPSEKPAEVPPTNGLTIPSGEIFAIPVQRATKSVPSGEITMP